MTGWCFNHLANATHPTTTNFLNSTVSPINKVITITRFTLRAVTKVYRSLCERRSLFFANQYIGARAREDDRDIRSRNDQSSTGVTTAIDLCNFQSRELVSC